MAELQLIVSSILVGHQQAEVRISILKLASNLIMEDFWLIVREIAKEFGISDGAEQIISLYDLGVHRVAAKFVP